MLSPTALLKTPLSQTSVASKAGGRWGQAGGARTLNQTPLVGEEINEFQSKLGTINYFAQGSHNHTLGNGREPRPNPNFLEIGQLDVSINFCGALFRQDSPRSEAAWAVTIMVPIFLYFCHDFCSAPFS